MSLKFMERSEHKFLDELGLAEAEYFKYSAKADPQHIYKRSCFAKHLSCLASQD